MKQLTLLLFLALFVSSNLYAGTIAGKVTAKETGEALVGANVYLKGTTVGAATDADGMYRIQVDDGTYTIVCDYVGYAVAEQEVDVSGTIKVNFQLTEYLFAQTINVVADRARERETPVAFSNVEQEAMDVRLGSRDIPLVLNTTPSVYATQQGGGAGDARINIRGFNQRNVAIMINGVPVNDMENGWVYWSNWDGVGDATSSIQVQRGLSAVNLATPSIGGTMNIITNPAQQKAGFRYKQEIGSGGFTKSTFFGHSGLIDGKYAFSGGVVRKTGDGVVNATWTDAWAYYLGASYNVNDDNRLEFYALGAPQRHGQNLYKQNIGTYSHDFARDLDDYDPAALDKFREQGPYFNQNWAAVDNDYSGSQYWNEDYDQRYDPDFLMERENFYHKPQVNLNWYSRLSDRLSLYSILYYSGGHGGGTGTLGDVYRRDATGKLGDADHRFYFGPSPWIWDWNATVEANRGGEGYYVVDQDSIYKEDGQSIGILRNSRNNQWTVGAISKAYYKVNENLNTSFGIDWRTAEIEHFREVRDLLGGQYWVKTVDEFNPNEKVGLGDKVAYNFTNTVDWLGAYGQGEYTSGPLTAYGMIGWSTIKYGYTNHFRMDSEGNELTAETDFIQGLQVKGGASYRLTREFNVFGNVGYVSKVPIFDAVISDRDGTKAEDPQNEKFTSFEAGVNYSGMGGKLNVKTNAYYTLWTDRTQNIGITNPDGSEGFVFVQGMNQLHTGVEFEAAFQPISIFRLDAGASYGMWQYTDNVSGTYKDYESGGEAEVEYDYYVKDLKVGDAPQTQLALAGSAFPMKGLQAQLVFKYYDRYYADWDPFTRTDPDETAEAWQTPAYGLFDLHANYDLPFHLSGVKVRLFAHVFNLLDTEYVRDATDNSRFNAFDYDHDADDAEVYFGLPRTFNIGLNIYY